jgi:DNA-directed RNA polymerase specialized sigma24 family protein
MRNQLTDPIIKNNEQGIDGQPFESLLRWLDPNREQAGEVYEQVRVKIMRFFEFQGCPFPEELADDTIQRAARKVSEGNVIRPTDPYIYFRGIARNVLLEYWKGRKKESTMLDDLPPSNHPVINPAEVDNQRMARTDKERMLDCLDSCLGNLPDRSRNLFVEYNKDEKRGRIDNRMTLAKSIGIDITTLRNRIMRIREKLQKCVTTCART